MKRVVKNILKKLGYSIVPTNIQNTFEPPNAFEDQKSLINSEDRIIIFDVGAHFGETALKFNQLFNNCIIYSFEPFFESFKILKESTQNYQNIEIIDIALWNKIGEINFHVNRSSGTNSILSTHEQGPNIWGDGLLDILGTIKINATTIDNFIEDNRISKIDILKLDTQGTECQVIEGAKEAIKKGLIKLIYMEIITMPTYRNQKTLDEILKVLRINNFNLYNMYNYSYTDKGELRQIDAIFLYNK